jgi:hypothetical protein
MTQELVLGVLLSGLLGLLWVMRLAMQEEPGSTHEAESSGGNDDVEHHERALKQHTIAA